MTLEALFAKVLRVPESTLSDASSPENVPGWDSLQGMYLLLAMQQAYGVEFTFEEVEAMVSLGDARRVLAAREVL